MFCLRNFPEEEKNSIFIEHIQEKWKKQPIKKILSLNFQLLLCREKDNDEGTIRVYPSRLGAAVTIEHTGINVTSNTVVTEVIGQALKKFGLPESKPQDYRLVEVMLDKGGGLGRRACRMQRCTKSWNASILCFWSGGTKSKIWTNCCLSLIC